MPHIGLDARDHFDAVISHSHGLAVCLMACAYCGARIPLLVDMAGPIRQDLKPVAFAARGQIGRWLHIHSD